MPKRALTPPAGAVQHFPISGEMIRKTLYLARTEWEALERRLQREKVKAERRADPNAPRVSANSIIREALRNFLNR